MGQTRGYTCDGVSSGCPTTPSDWTTTATVHDCDDDEVCSPDTLTCVPATSCSCTASSCDDLGKECGDWPDGCDGIVSCGTCGDGETCTGGHCGCTPTTCLEVGAACGEAPDGCGGTLECGVCPTGYDCVDGACACQGDACAAGTIALEITGPAVDGVEDIVFDVEVVRDLDVQSVAQRRVTSSSHGGPGTLFSLDIPCDPTIDSGFDVPVNVVAVWVVGAYAAEVSAPGPFAAGDGSEISEPSVSLFEPSSFGPIQIALECIPGETVDAPLTLTLARPAEQGFFDVAMSLNGLFCTATFDCCADADHDGCEPGEALTPLLDESGQPARTFVFDFACTAGLDPNVTLELALDDILLSCAASAGGVILIDPDGPTGDQCVAGQLADCPAILEGGVDRLLSRC